jgi:hypothetical protein
MANEKTILADFLNAKVPNLRDGTTNWIFPNMTNEPPTEDEFPRVYLTNNAGTANRMGNNVAIVAYNKNTQITIYVKRGFIYNEDDVDYEGDFLADLIGQKITDAFEEFGSELYPNLFDIDIATTLTDMDFDYDKDVIVKFLTVDYTHLKL